MIKQILRNFSQSAFLVRDTKYGFVNNQDLLYFKEILGKDFVLTESDKGKLEKYNYDISQRFEGLTKTVLFPQDVSQISKVLSYCNHKNLPVVPQGGRTSINMGGISLFDETIISFEKYNKISSFDPYTGILSCQCGTTIKSINDAIRMNEFNFPIKLPFQDRAQIGGAVALNLQGYRSPQFGKLRDALSSLSIISSKGEVLDFKTKGSIIAGYDLKQLLIGSEGTLGIIKDCEIKCNRIPKSNCMLLLGFSNFEASLHCIDDAIKQFGYNFLSSIHIFDKDLWVKDKITIDKNFGYNDSSPIILMIEMMTDLINFNLEKNALELKERIKHEEFLLYKNTNEIEKIWLHIENVDKYISFFSNGFRIGLNIPFLKISKFLNTICAISEKLSPSIKYNFFTQEMILFFDSSYINDLDKEKFQKLIKYIQDEVQKEEGIGFDENKAGFHNALQILSQHKDNVLDMMINIKAMLDPNKIMNPYKMVPHGRNVLWKS